MPTARNVLLTLVHTLITQVFVVCCIRLDLTGTWTVSNAAKGILFTGRVPGSMYTALLDNHLIPDPLYRDNDVTLAWIGHENWTYTRSFEVSSTIAQYQTILLVAEGLDTVASISINGQPVAKTYDMYLKYSFDVKSLLKVGSNSLEVSFESAVEFAARQAASYPYEVPFTCPSPVQHGECHVNFIRKEPCSFSWDWGPSFPTQGIWKPIYLDAFDSAVLYLASVEVVPDARGQGWELRTKIYFNVSSSGSGSVNGKMDIHLDGTNISESRILTLTTTMNWAEVNISVPQSANVKRWWPNGYGQQALYDVGFKFTASSGEVTSLRRRIGFRTVELVQDRVSAFSQQGLTFYFRVNGIPVFFKGSNWIPADSFQERISRERLSSLLQSAADAHINSMRVWGGGVYESDDFYDLTDELGIMIWQDLMYSDALYPTDSAFMDNVTQEVRYQVRRLLHRPSIALWSGNNENEGILRSMSGNQNYSVYYNDYIKLYITTIMALVKTENPSRVFVPSSPSNGNEAAKEGYVDKDPLSEFFGDIHFYQYDIDQWRPDSFKIPRFTSEYGVQSWCNYQTLLNVFQQADMNYSSAQVDHRQHHPNGNAEMLNETTRHLAEPPTTTPEPRRFRDIIYLTQINQAMSIRSQSEHYRRHQSTLLPDGRGLTMGALYWQLNDIWQAPTWASIDYSGSWKMLHYYACKFFSPLIVSPFLDDSVFDVFIVVDEIAITDVRDPSSQRLRFEPMTEVKDILFSNVAREDVLDLAAKVKQQVSGVLHVQMFAWNSFNPLHQWDVPYGLITTAESVLRLNVSTMMAQAGCSSERDCFIYTYVNDSNSGIDNWLYLAELKESSVQKAQVKVADVVQDSVREFTITLSTNAIAPFVWLEAGSITGRFSDNGFLLHTPSTTVKFLAWENVDTQTLRSMLTVSSLADVYA